MLRVLPSLPDDRLSASAAGHDEGPSLDPDDGDHAREDGVLVTALRDGDRDAAAALWDRHGEHVRRVLTRVLGAGDPEHRDLVQEVWRRALAGLGGLDRGGALKPWLTSIAVFTARETIRRRRRWRWLSFTAEPPEVPSACAPGDVQEAARCVYRVLDRMPADERIVFALRMVDGMELAEVAHATGLSFATVRRRLKSAHQRFFELARRYEALAAWTDVKELGE